MKSLVLTLGICGLAFGQSGHPTFFTFDVPGAISTTPLSINEGGAITGAYIDAGRLQHGFVRAPDGAITTFDPIPGVFTFPVAIEQDGAIAGYLQSGSGAFVRSPDGALTTFDASGGFGCTSANSISRGVITGTYCDANSLVHGFVRSRNGDITSFDPPGATQGANGINAAGEVTGSYLDSSEITHGFLRSAAGVITSFDVPGKGVRSTVPLAINFAGDVAGYYFDENGFHGFVRSPDGTIAKYDAVAGPGQGTMPTSLSPSGAVVGFHFTNTRTAAYLRGHDGAITLFNVPGAEQTIAYGINQAGVITGYYSNSQGTHGFIRTP